MWVLIPTDRTLLTPHCTYDRRPKFRPKTNSSSNTPPHQQKPAAQDFYPEPRVIVKWNVRGRRGPSAALDHYPGRRCRPVSPSNWQISSVLSDFTLVEDDCNPIIEVTNLAPVVIICESSRSYSTKRTRRQLLSVRIGPSLNLILSIFRKPRNSMASIEVLHKQFRDKILPSQENAKFRFQVWMSNNITFPPGEITARWIT